MADDDNEDFASLFAASESAARQRLKLGDRVRGRVVGIGPETAFVALGAKAEAVIGIAEFRDPTTGEVAVKVGDEIEATVTDDGSRSGTLVLKRVFGRGGHVPGELEQALAHGIAIEGMVTGQNKGGFDVQVAGVRAFCPASQIDLRRGDPASYIGQRLQFRVTRVEAGGRNVVVARRPLLEEETARRAADIWERLHVGDVVRGTVSSLRDFGAFVDLGGVDGLIHLSELSHGRAAHPSDVLQVGQEVEAKIMALEPATAGGRGRIGLSLRALAPDPWVAAVERLRPGSSTQGTVRRLEQFGAFVELAPGVDGLVHVSRLALDRRVAHPRQVVAIGDTVEVTIVSIDPEKRRIALSMVDQARQARDAAEDSERKETTDILERSNESKSLGTLADLLSSAKPPRR